MVEEAPTLEDEWLANVAWITDLTEHDLIDSQDVGDALHRLEQFMIDSKEEYLTHDFEHVTDDIITALSWALKIRDRDFPSPMPDPSHITHGAIDWTAPPPPAPTHDGCKFCNLE